MFYDFFLALFRSIFSFYVLFFTVIAKDIASEFIKHHTFSPSVARRDSRNKNLAGTEASEGGKKLSEAR
jgi:hypothetical protein